MEEKPKETLKVLDRRKFTPDGQLREGVDLFPPAASPPEPQKPPLPAVPEGGPERPSAPAEPTSVFSVLVQDLAQSCAFNLGLIPDPTTGRARVDLQSAGLYIDFLDTLQKKTSGNLDPQEKQVLEDWLFQLKMLYAKASQKRPQ